MVQMGCFHVLKFNVIITDEEQGPSLQFANINSTNILPDNYLVVTESLNPFIM